MGVVDAVGQASDEEWLGRRVAGENEVGCLTCAACRSGHWRWCSAYQQIGFGRYGGSYSECLVAPCYGLHALPTEVSNEQGALLEPLAVAFGCLRRADLHFGETVTIIGDGPIGLNVLRLAVVAGARRVMVVGEQAPRLALADEWGAFRVLDHRRDAVNAEVMRWHGRSDVVVEATGTEAGLNQALSLVRPEGRIVVAGFAHGTETRISPDAIHLPDVMVIGAGNNPGWMGAALDLVLDQMVDTVGLISHRYPLGAYSEAFDQLRTRGQGLIKSIFVMA
jgi:threonine dehydrogenase-like Zn-dependent dehydrogenase